MWLLQDHVFFGYHYILVFPIFEIDRNRLIKQYDGINPSTVTYLTKGHTSSWGHCSIESLKTPYIQPVSVTLFYTLFFTSHLSTLLEAPKVVFMAHNPQSRLFQQWSYKVCFLSLLLVFDRSIKMRQIQKYSVSVRCCSTTSFQKSFIKIIFNNFISIHPFIHVFLPISHSSVPFPYELHESECCLFDRRCSM